MVYVRPSLLFFLILIILWKRLLNLKSLDIVLLIYRRVLLLLKLRLVERLLLLKLLQVSLLANLRMLGVFNTILYWFFYFFLYFCLVICLLDYLLILGWRLILLLRLIWCLNLLGFSVDFSWTHFDLRFHRCLDFKCWHNRIWTLFGESNDMLSSKADHHDWIFLEHSGFKLIRFKFIFIFSVTEVHIGAKSPRVDHQS